MSTVLPPPPLAAAVDVLEAAAPPALLLVLVLLLLLLPQAPTASMVPSTRQALPTLARTLIFAGSSCWSNPAGLATVCAA